jgi:polyhydroxyalkanoate synthesis regulator phasin
MTEQRSGGLAEGIRTGIGMLAAFKDALEETLEEAIARGDLSPERAKGVVRDTASRVQSTLEDARERLEIVSRKEFEALRREVDELRARLDRAEGGASWGSVEQGAREVDAGDVPID